MKLADGLLRRFMFWKSTFLFLVLMSFGFADSISESRKQDLDFILNSEYFRHEKELTENIASSVTIQHEKKTMETALLAEKFLEEIKQENGLEVFYPIYSSFSDAELKEIRETLNNPTLQKFYEGRFSDCFASFLSIVQEKMNGILEEQGLDRETPKLALEDANVVEVTKENFYEAIILAKTPVILDFYSAHCGPCKCLEMYLPDLCAKYEGKIQFARMNVVEQREIAGHFKVQGVPTLLFLAPGSPWPKVVNQTVGFGSIELFEEDIASFLKETL